MSSKFSDWYLYKRDSDTQGRRPCKDRGRIGMMQPKPRNCWQPPGARKRQKGFFPRACRGNMALLDTFILDF